MKAVLFGFGKRGKVWAKHLTQAGFELSIYDPAFNMFNKPPTLQECAAADLCVIASSTPNHAENIKLCPNTYSTFIEKPVVSQLKDLELLRYQSPIYGERFKYATQFVKSLNLHPTQVHSVMTDGRDFILDKLIHHIDLVEYLWNISNKPKYVPSYSLESPVYKGKFVYTQVEENRVSLLIIFCNKDTIILDLVNNTVSINFDGICFGPQETVPEVLKSKNRVYEDWSNGATRRAIELYHESISKYSGPQ